MKLAPSMVTLQGLVPIGLHGGCRIAFFCGCAQPMRDDVTLSPSGWAHKQNDPCRRPFALLAPLAENVMASIWCQDICHLNADLTATIVSHEWYYVTYISHSLFSKLCWAEDKKLTAFLAVGLMATMFKHCSEIHWVKSNSLRPSYTYMSMN